MRHAGSEKQETTATGFQTGPVAVASVLLGLAAVSWTPSVSAEHAASTSSGTFGASCDGGAGAGSDCQGSYCCERLKVPGGRLELGDKSKDVAPFWLDKYEATVGRFEAWVRAGRPLPDVGTVMYENDEGKPVTWTAAAASFVQTEKTLAGWAKYDTYRAGLHTAPKNSVNFYTAMAFCHFDGGRLPTQDEWAYAVVGGDEKRRHPWGDEPPTFDHAVYNCAGDGDGQCDLADLLPVGSKPKGKGRWGHHDLAGSVFEWTINGEMRHLYVEEALSGGGGFCYIGGMDRRAPPGLSAQTMRYDAPNTASHTVGVRCAYD